MRRLNSDQDDDDECNVVDYTSPNLDEVCVHFAEHNLIPFEELRSECERDEWAKRIIRRVIHGNWKACTQAESIFEKVSRFLTVENGLLYNGTRPHNPSRMRNIVIERAHDMHPEVQATKNAVNLMPWWPGLGKDVEEIISACSECAKILPRTEKLVDTWPDAQPWETIHGLGLSPKSRQHFHNCRRWFWLDRSVHMRRRPWEKVILFMPAICGRFGVPRTLVSNNFKEFINNEVVTRSHA